MANLATPVSVRDHLLGNREAAVMLVMYGDYECPFTRKAYQTLKDIRQKGNQDFSLAYRQFPITKLHPHAMQASQAALAAGLQGKFWDLHDLLFEHQDALTEDDLERYARELGLDVARFEQDMRADAARRRIREDQQSGLESGVPGTPTLFLNGEMYQGHLWRRALEAAIEQAA